MCQKVATPLKSEGGDFQWLFGWDSWCNCHPERYLLHGPRCASQVYGWLPLPDLMASGPYSRSTQVAVSQVVRGDPVQTHHFYPPFPIGVGCCVWVHTELLGHRKLDGLLPRRWASLYFQLPGPQALEIQHGCKVKLLPTGLTLTFNP